MLRFVRKIKQIGNRHLHSVRQFVLCDSRLNLWIANVVVLQLVQFRQRVEHCAPHVSRNTPRIGDVQHRVALVAKLYSLMLRRQKTAAPQSVIQRLALFRGSLAAHRHKGRQIVILAAKPVANPRPDARSAGDL